MAEEWYGYEPKGPEPVRAFREGCGLTDAAAFAAAVEAAGAVKDAALAARYGLLSLGFADTHDLCLELDATAREYAVVGEAWRRARDRDRDKEKRAWFARGAPLGGGQT